MSLESGGVPSGGAPATTLESAAYRVRVAVAQSLRAGSAPAPATIRACQNLVSEYDRQIQISQQRPASRSGEKGARGGGYSFYSTKQQQKTVVTRHLNSPFPARADQQTTYDRKPSGLPLPPAPPLAGSMASLRLETELPYSRRASD